MQLLKKIMTAIEKTNIFIGKLMVGVTLVAVAVITFEVVMRYVFGLPTNWGHELMTLLFAVQYMFVAGYCHYHRAHIGSRFQTDYRYGWYGATSGSSV